MRGPDGSAENSGVSRHYRKEGSPYEPLGDPPHDPAQEHIQSPQEKLPGEFESTLTSLYMMRANARIKRNKVELGAEDFERSVAILERRLTARRPQYLVEDDSKRLRSSSEREELTVRLK